MNYRLGLITLGLVSALTLSVGFADGQGKADKPARKDKSADATLAGPKTDKDHAPKPKDFAGQNKRHGEAGPITPILKNLDLTPDQQEKIKQLVKEHTDKVMQFKAETKTQVDSLRQEAEAAKTTGDKAKGESIRAQLQSIEQTMPKRTELASQIALVLTPEQREKFRAQMQEMRSMDGKPKPHGPKPMNADGMGKEGKGKDGQERKGPKADKGGAEKSNDSKQLKL
jgi:Spy/CpxP family protein refolding chaperone